MGKEKNAITVLTTIFIFHKSAVKTFLKQIVNQCPKGTCQHDPRFKGILIVTYACIKVPKHHIHEKQEVQMYKKFCNCQGNWISK